MILQSTCIYLYNSFWGYICYSVVVFIHVIEMNYKLKHET